MTKEERYKKLTVGTDPEAVVKQIIQWRDERLKTMKVRDMTFIQQRKYLDTL